MDLHVKAVVEVPKVPNFLRLSDGQTMPLSAFSAAGLRRIGKAWGEELVARAKEQRESAAGATMSDTSRALVAAKGESDG